MKAPESPDGPDPGSGTPSVPVILLHAVMEPAVPGAWERLPNPATVRDFVATDRTRLTARVKLEGLGLSVVYESPTTLSVLVTRDRLEELFGRVRPVPAPGGKGEGEVYYEFVGTPRVPESLRPEIIAAILPRPAVPLG